MRFSHAYAALATLAVAVAAPSKDTMAVCQRLASLHPNIVAFDPETNALKQSLALTAAYEETNSVYWNAQNSEYRAACAFLPENADQVSSAVKLLNQFPSVKFALKSGGHNPAPGFSATDGGVLISFEPNLNSTVRTDDGQHFIVGAGARWSSVYETASETNQVAVGGRLGHIGVTGFVVGGGLSYYSAQYGLACDNVDTFEAVLADGSIVKASKDDNSDLWFALRGGGNQFAIITRMWMQAHPLGDNGKVWGGIRVYSALKRKDLFKALANFIAKNTDTKAAIIPTFQFALPGNIATALAGPGFFFFYDGATPPKGIFDEFDAILSLSDGTKTTTYPEMTSNAGGGAPLPGFRSSFETGTFPNMPTTQMSEFLNEYFNRAYNTTFHNSLALDIRIGGFDPQPVPTLVAKASQAQGGNALGLDPANGDRIFVENNLLWLSDGCNEKCPASFASLAAGMTAYHKQNFAGVKPTNYQEGDVEHISYNPLFMNDAGPNQDVYSSYTPEILSKLKAAKAKYDPNGFFTNRQGGFKLPA